MAKESESEAIATAVTVAKIGAGAGVAIAGIFAVPLLIPALVGAGIGCLGGAVIAATKKDK